MEPGLPVEWEALKPGTVYMFLPRMGRPDVGTVQGYTSPAKEAVRITPFLPHLPYAMPAVTVWKSDVKQVYRPKNAFAEKLARLNTKLEADPGVLSEIMKFKSSQFKGTSWKGMVEAQKAVTSDRKTETARQEAEALAAMKTGGRKTRRSRRRRTRRRV